MSNEIYQTIQKREQSKSAKTNEATHLLLSKEDYAAKKQGERDGVFALLDKVTKRVQKDREALRGVLDVMARFSKYSTNNTLLIFEQMPNATRLAGFDTWKRQNESVIQGQHAISILEPGDEYTRDDGSIGVSINVRKVFDERQTSARHIEPRYPESMELIKALINSSPVPVKVVQTLGDGASLALFNASENAVFVKEGLTENEFLSALITESVHAELSSTDNHYTRDSSVKTAELATYVLAKRYGAHSLQIMPDTTPDTEGKLLADTKAELSKVRDVSKAISDRVDKEIEKSRTEKTQKGQVKRGGKDDR